nr:Chain A, Chlamydomonas reinhardtii THB1 [Chlamydomonas reinhardtii]4XDI_B Chain B, Chlamydomonas reinhardtii THB1 [Chlamydomonas reinhardtii]6CII_A Chain A, Chlamydomonas reinhardtii THB1 [Chlamydomonas reinhardtii]
AADTAPADSLYSRMGGEAAVEKAVDVFYERIVADPQLAPFFANVDMKKQRRKQVAFMTYVFGGSGAYEGRDLGASHRRLIREQGMNHHHFDLVAAHLDSTLQELGVAQELKAEAMAIVASARPLIFGTGEAGAAN